MLELTVWVNPAPFPYSCALINKNLLRRGPTVPHVTSYLPSTDPDFGVEMCVECDLGDDELHFDRVDETHSQFLDSTYRNTWFANNDVNETDGLKTETSTNKFEEGSTDNAIETASNSAANTTENTARTDED